MHISAHNSTKQTIFISELLPIFVESECMAVAKNRKNGEIKIRTD